MESRQSKQRRGCLGDLGSFPPSLQVSEVGGPQLHFSKLDRVLVAFPVEPVHTLDRTNALNDAADANASHHRGFLYHLHRTNASYSSGYLLCKHQLLLQVMNKYGTHDFTHGCRWLTIDPHISTVAAAARRRDCTLL